MLGYVDSWDMFVDEVILKIEEQKLPKHHKYQNV